MCQLIIYITQLLMFFLTPLHQFETIYIARAGQLQSIYSSVFLKQNVLKGTVFANKMRFSNL